MTSIRTWLRGSMGLVGVLFCCWGCVAPSPAGKVSTGEGPGVVQEETAASAAPEAGSAKVATLLIGVQVQGTPDETVVVLTGNGSFKDYQFRRVGDRGFSLELGDIKDPNGVPSLPMLPEYFDLRYGESGAPGMRGVELVGGLKKPLDNYIVNTVGNSLALTLYSSSGLPPAMASHSGAASSVGKRKKTTSQGGTVEPSSSGNITAGGRTVTAKRRGDDEGESKAPGVKKKYTGKPISLDLLDADLRNVLRLISEVTGTNIVIEPDVAGRVTLKVEQVPWDQVLDMVLAMNNLGMEQRGNVIRIAKTTKLKDEMNQQYDEIKARQELMEAAKDIGELTTEYLTVNYAPPAEMAQRINEIKSEKAKLSIDERTNLIIYTDYPTRIAIARQLLKRLDKPIPQVMIEARIVTMDDDVSRSLGIRWNLNFNNSSPLHNDFAVNWLSSAAGTAFGWNLGTVIGSTMMNLDFNIAALESTNRSKVLAAPKVLTINNVKAVISQGNQIPYLQQSAADGGVVSTVFKDAIVELQVTPHITPDGKVRMEIEAKQDEPNDALKGQDGQPAIATRKIKTELLVADGCIVVIGGVMREIQSKNLNSTPGLGNVPIIGRLFKQENQRRTRQELLIFISPKIVES
jgi:type IV pilus assembly protein PilQ